MRILITGFPRKGPRKQLLEMYYLSICQPCLKTRCLSWYDKAIAQNCGLGLQRRSSNSHSLTRVLWGPSLEDLRVFSHLSLQQTKQRGLNQATFLTVSLKPWFVWLSERWASWWAGWTLEVACQSGVWGTHVMEVLHRQWPLTPWDYLVFYHFSEVLDIKIFTFTGTSYCFTLPSLADYFIVYFLPWNNVVVCWLSMSNLTAGSSFCVWISYCLFCAPPMRSPKLLAAWCAGTAGFSQGALRLLCWWPSLNDGTHGFIICLNAPLKMISSNCLCELGAQLCFPGISASAVRLSLLPH